MNDGMIQPKGRSFIKAKAQREKSVLEIGPFCNPVLQGENVYYFDVLDRQGLIERAIAVNYPIIHAPDINYVSPTGDLSVVDEKFDAVLSSHCIEHQPDLIGHLQQVSNLLIGGGSYYLIIPDARFCFDAMIGRSSIAEVIAAHLEGRKNHTLQSVIEHRALTTHNDSGRHWRMINTDPEYEQMILDRIPMAIAEFKSANGGYIDVHAWQFVPETFSQLVLLLQKLGYIDFEVAYLEQPLKDHNEFTAILRKI